VTHSMIAGDLFTGRLVRLSAILPDDKNVFAQWTNDAAFERLWSGAAVRPRPPEYFAAEQERAKDSDYRTFEFAIRNLADDRLIGVSELNVTWVQQIAWLGIGIGESDYRGKGYGSEALWLTVSYAFRELNLYKVSLGTYSYNAHAQHVYEKAGFVREGVIRGALQRDGVRYDDIMMGILRSEWEAKDLARSATS